MNTSTSKYKILLGMFIVGGLTLFVLAVFIIGKQKNLFSPVFTLNTCFRNISGLQVGNNVRFSGINVGTIDEIRIINDSTALVSFIVQKEVQQFIKTDCKAAIGSEGIIGDRLLIITQGNSPISVKSGQVLASTEPIEIDAIITKLKITIDNTAIITEQMAQILLKINNGKGSLGRLIKDTAMAENIKQTIVNLKQSSKGLDENMNAAKNSFLLKGYFKKKERQEAEKKAAEKNGNENTETRREKRKRKAQKKMDDEKQKAVDINSNK